MDIVALRARRWIRHQLPRFETVSIAGARPAIEAHIEHAVRPARHRDLSTILDGK
jgi:hypothetical protein